MARENYYCLLELDCDVSDPSVIDDAIRRKQAEWSTGQTHPKRGRQCQANLERIGDIRAVMSDPAKRAEEASECIRLRQKREKEAAKEIDAAIKILAVANFLTEAQVAHLARKFKGRFTEDQIRQRIKVPIRSAEENDNRSPKPTVDPSLFKEIADRLQRVGKADLYDFLDLRRNASLATLGAKAKAADAEARKYNEKTAEVTTRQELAGYCLRFFKDDNERQKYDNALDMQGLLKLDPLIELAGTSGIIAAEVVDELMRKAREWGIEPGDARDYILTFASKRRWSVQIPRASRVPELQHCACGVLNPESAKTCGHCGRLLREECPKCRTVNPAENRACSRCGFAIGDLDLARRLIRDADVSLARGEVDRVISLLKEAQVYWPGAAEIDSRLATAQSRHDAQAQAHRRAVEALADRRLQEARVRLNEFRSVAPTHPELDALGREIDLGLRSAAEYVDRARTFERAGRPDDAGAAYAEAVRECRDLREALDGTARFPPEPPADLQAIATVNGVSLRWLASPSRGPIRYRIVRKVGSEPRTSADGANVAEVATMSLTDADAPAGDLLYYTAFADRGGVLSARAAVARPVLRLAEVSALRSTAGDGCVGLDWRAPERAVGVEVWRREGVPPRQCGDGVRVTGNSLNSASDTGLANGREYGYRVVVLFRGPDGKVVPSDGVTCTVVPVPPPRPVLDLVFQKRGSQFEVSWTPPPRGQVYVYVTEGRIPDRGAILPLTDLDAIGHRVPGVGSNTARGQVDARSVVQLVPVTVDGSVAVVGQSVAMSWVDDVEGVSATYHDGTLRARWTWPAGIEAALVSVRSDRSPSGPDDSAATHVLWMKYQSEREGGFRHPWPMLTDRLFIVVRAALHDGGRWIYASGTIPGARAEVAVGRRRTATFRVAPVPGRWGLVRSGEYELALSPDAATELPALVLVAKPGGRPLSPKGGKPVLRIPRGVHCAPDRPLRETFRPEGLAGKHGVWLFPEDNADCSWFDLRPAASAGYWIG